MTHMTNIQQSKLHLGKNTVFNNIDIGLIKTDDLLWQVVNFTAFQNSKICNQCVFSLL